MALQLTPLVGTTGRQMVTDMRILCEKIISGEIIGAPNSINLGERKIDVRMAEYGLAEIWYDPENIQPARWDPAFPARMVLLGLALGIV